MITLIKSIEAEYCRYKAVAEAALAQVPEASLSQAGSAGSAEGEGNSLAILCWHLSGNLRSRFTDFLASDGEKPWRQRDEEFAVRTVSRAELLARWQQGWDVLLATLGQLTDADLTKTVLIRGQPLAVHEALHRSLAHASYHVGQIVSLAHAMCGADWRYLSIPPGGSAAYNANPQQEKPGAHAEALGPYAVRGVSTRMPVRTSPMQLSAARIFVLELATARRFYESMLGLTVKHDGTSYGFCVFDAGGLDLVVEALPEDAPPEDRALVGRFTGLSFAVANVATEHERLSSAGVVFSGAPERQSWGGTLATMRDPAGNEIQLVQYPA